MTDYFRYQNREYVITDRVEVSCDGSAGALGHPREFIHLSREGEARCKYCDRIFVLSSTQMAKTAREDGEAIANPAGHMAS